jgi:hypothetical protein
MKQERFLLVIGIIFLTLFQVAAAHAAAGNGAVAQATLTAYELDAVPADQPLDAQPRWRSSLSEIQQSATTLLDTNTKLNTESRQLNSDFGGLQAKIDQQRVKNAQILDRITEVRGKAEENNDQAQIFRLKGILADRGREVQSQKEMLAVLGTRRGSVDSRLALLRLRLAELEVDQKSRNVDGKFQDETAKNALRTANQGLRDAVDKGEMQVKLLTEKTDELNRLDNPYIAQTREILANNSELRKRWMDLQDKKNAAQVQFELVAANKLKAEKDHNVSFVQKLLSERDILQARLKDNTKKLEDLKADVGGPDKMIAGISLAAMDKLQKQNAVMEELIGNIRENIALLEYKVSTLKRYKDRNKSGLPN